MTTTYRLMPCKSLHRAAPGCTEHGPTALYGPSIPRPWPAPPPGLICSEVAAADSRWGFLMITKNC
jgi:hypothetical protein